MREIYQDKYNKSVSRFLYFVFCSLSDLPSLVWMFMHTPIYKR